MDLNGALKVVSILFPVAVLLVGPKDALLKELVRGRGLRVWHKETIVVGALLTIVITVCQHHFPTPSPDTEWVGWAALLFAHGRNSVMSRMMEVQERLAAKADPEAVKALVPCWWWAGFYLYAGESFWAIYFLRHSAWAALGGVGVFVGFFRWRRWYTASRARST